MPRSTIDICVGARACGGVTAVASGGVTCACTRYHQGPGLSVSHAGFDRSLRRIRREGQGWRTPHDVKGECSPRRGNLRVGPKPLDRGRRIAQRRDLFFQRHPRHHVCRPAGQRQRHVAKRHGREVLGNIEARVVCRTKAASWGAGCGALCECGLCGWMGRYDGEPSEGDALRIHGGARPGQCGRGRPAGRVPSGVLTELGTVFLVKHGATVGGSWRQRRRRRRRRRDRVA